MNITKANIQTMKQAGVILFKTEKDISTIECLKKDEYNSTYTIQVETKINSINKCCFSHHELYDRELCPVKTMVSLLKEADTIQLVWDENAGNTKDLIETGFVSDYFYIEILRKEKIKYKFLIAVNTGKDNSGRMIKNGCINENNITI